MEHSVRFYNRINYGIEITLENMKYRKRQEEIQKECFPKEKLGGVFGNSNYGFVVKDYRDNFMSHVDVDSVQNYFRDNKIGWWRGMQPTGHTLSSQMSCINHLYSIRNDHDAVLAIARSVDSKIDDVEILKNDTESWRGYISFEVVSRVDHLNEKKGKNKELTRGSQCTSIDAVILARKEGKSVLMAIEWKYVEHYRNTDKSRDTGNKTSGAIRVNNYSGSDNVANPKLIDNSNQLKTLESYNGSVYFFEPFYQLMRQTLWAEQMIKFCQQEIIKADDYIHIHVVPEDNTELRGNYKCSGKNMCDTWNEMLNEPSKYVLISPEKLMSNLPEEYKDLVDSLRKRYWR